jgi:hypothetical protein
MARKKEGRKSGGARKIGRKNRPKDQKLSAYVRDKITFEQYNKK